MSFSTLRKLIILAVVGLFIYQVFFVKSPRLALTTVWSNFGCKQKPTRLTDIYCDPFLEYEINYPEGWSVRAPKQYAPLKATVEFDGPTYTPKAGEKKQQPMVPHMVVYPLKDLDLTLTGKRKLVQEYLGTLTKGVTETSEALAVVNGAGYLIETIDGEEGQKWHRVLVAAKVDKTTMAVLAKIPEAKWFLYEQAVMEAMKSLRLAYDKAPPGI